MPRILIHASASALLTILAAGCGEASKEAAKPTLSQDFEKSADELAARLTAPGGDGQMPAPTDPVVTAFDAQATKALAALGTPALPVDGFETFQELCGRTAKIVGAYIGAGASGGSGVAGADRKQMETNVARYLDQMFTPLLFAAHCSASHLPFLEKQVDPADTSKAAALQQVRSGAFAQTVGLMQLAAADDLDAGRKRRIADLLAQDAASFAIALNPQQRRQVAQMAAELKPALPEDVRAQADKIKAGFESAPCGKLCAI